MQEWKQAPACCCFGTFLFWSCHFRDKVNELPNNWEEEKKKKCIKEAIKISSARGYPQVEDWNVISLFTVELVFLWTTRNKERFFWYNTDISSVCRWARDKMEFYLVWLFNFSLIKQQLCVILHSASCVMNSFHLIWVVQLLFLHILSVFSYFSMLNYLFFYICPSTAPSYAHSASPHLNKLLGLCGTFYIGATQAWSSVK